MATTQTIDMRRNPYRGIYKELAEEEGVSRQAIREAIHVYRNPRLCKRFAEKVREREEAVAIVDRVTGGGA